MISTVNKSLNILGFVEYLVLDACKRYQALLSVHLQCSLRDAEYLAHILIIHPVLESKILRGSTLSVQSILKLTDMAAYLIKCFLVYTYDFHII